MTSSLIGAEAADPGAKAPNVLLSREQGSSILNAGIINLGLGEPWLFVRYAGSVIPAISSGKRAEVGPGGHDGPRRADCSTGEKCAASGVWGRAKTQ